MPPDTAPDDRIVDAPPEPRPGEDIIRAALAAGDYLGAQRDARMLGLEDLVPPPPRPIDQGARSAVRFVASIDEQIAQAERDGNWAESARLKLGRMADIAATNALNR